METLKREIKFFPAFDKRKAEDGKNYGVHGCDLSFAVIGEDKAVRLMVFTNWHLLPVREEFDRNVNSNKFPYYHPDSAGISYHEGSLDGKFDCDLLNTKCNGDTWYSGLADDEWYKILTEKGSDGIFEKLEEIYRETYEE